MKIWASYLRGKAVNIILEEEIMNNQNKNQNSNQNTNQNQNQNQNQNSNETKNTNNR